VSNARSPTLDLNNGVTMPALGFGVFQTPPEQTSASVETALGVGYRLIDTAAAYGNEREVGEGFSRSGFDRDDVFLECRAPAIPRSSRRGSGAEPRGRFATNPRNEAASCARRSVALCPADGSLERRLVTERDATDAQAWDLRTLPHGRKMCARCQPTVSASRRTRVRASSLSNIRPPGGIGRYDSHFLTFFKEWNRTIRSSALARPPSSSG
jgi:hypothetical protein